MIGKVSPETLTTEILSRTGADDPRVLVGPAYGEDTAAIDLGEQILVVSTDPLSLAADQVGRLGIHVACNDVAASGADPAWVTNCLFLPDEDPATIEDVTRQLDTTAREIGVAIIGGHAEYAPQLDRPLLALTAFGLTDRYVSSGGASAGEKIVLTAGAGIEGTAILATDFAEHLEDDVDAAVLERARGFMDEISVRHAARAIRDDATSMHDPTEGGVLAALVEMAVAADVSFELESAAVPVRDETSTLCAAMEVDPLQIFGSGALLATVPPEDAESACRAVRETGTSADVIGEVTPGSGAVLLDGEHIEAAPRDDLYALWE